MRYTLKKFQLDQTFVYLFLGTLFIKAQWPSHDQHLRIKVNFVPSSQYALHNTRNNFVRKPLSATFLRQNSQALMAIEFYGYIWGYLAKN